MAIPVVKRSNEPAISLLFSQPNLCYSRKPIHHQFILNNKLHHNGQAYVLRRHAFPRGFFCCR